MDSAANSEKRSGKKIAIVGSGPAGLASADQLNQAGHSVTVYERSDRPGGLLMYGIPSMKLEKRCRTPHQTVDTGRRRLCHQYGNRQRYYSRRTKRTVRCDYPLHRGPKQRDLLIEGREAKGVHFAMDYLTGTIKSMLDSNFKDKQFINTKNKDVIVIGGGDTGADCVATALRQKREASSNSASIRSCPIQGPPKICGRNSRMSIRWTMPMKRRKQYSETIRDNIRSKQKACRR